MGSPGHPNLTTHPLDTETSYDYMESSSSELHLLIRFQTFLPPILIVTGTLGNLSSFLALRRPTLARHSIALYTSAYLAASTAYLYAGCAHEWVSHTTGLPNISHVADWTCRLWKYIFAVVRHSVDWLLVTMVTDRVVATRPALATYRSVLCTPFTARIAIVGVFIGLTVVSIHGMWIYGVGTGTDGTCGIDVGQTDLGSIAWPWLSAVALSYIPNTLVLVLAPLLTVEYLSRVLYNRRNPSDESSMDRNDDSADESVQSGFTVCCICVAITFLLCTVPANLVNIFWYVNPPDLFTWYASFATCSMVTCLQSSVTFVWCYVCVRSVRAESRAMLGEFCERCSNWRRRRVDGTYAGVIACQEEHAMETDGTLV